MQRNRFLVRCVKRHNLSRKGMVDKLKKINSRECKHYETSSIFIYYIFRICIDCKLAGPEHRGGDGKFLIA